MNPVDEILSKLENCIRNNTYEKIETDRYEIKDNSHNSSDWKEVYKTANAFLNSKGGIIFVGINENKDNSQYFFTGFDFKSEDKIKELPKQFTDEKGGKLNLERYFPDYEIREFNNGKLLLIYVDALPDDEKFAYFNGKAYERQITGDHIISDNKIEAHKEYKQQIKDAKELMPVVGATMDDLDNDKLNQYIYLLNRIKKTETQKATISEAESFLKRKKMILGSEPTILGMLTCGKNPEDFLHNRCQIDCYVDHPQKEVVALSRRILIDTVINLMEEGVNFVVQNINVGISVEKGGSSIYQYPIELIRESINNSLAHRDYSIDRFVTIKVSPNKQIEIRNPGRFKKQLLIDVSGKLPVKRVVPGDPLANNPRLADVLKVFNKWEGQGIGMASLTGACLHNQIDLPYYLFHSQDELSLIIPSGKLVDSHMESLFETYSGYFKEKLKKESLSEEQKRVLAYLYKSELANKLSRYTILLTRDNNHMNAIRSLLDAELIFQHSESNSINPVYILDRQLFVEDYTDRLKEIYGDSLLPLKEDYKLVLSLIYEANNFSNERNLSANKIGNILWLRKGNEGIVDGFEDFKRKVRYIVSRLEKSGFISKVSRNPQYKINLDFKNMSGLF